MKTTYTTLRTVIFVFGFVGLWSLCAYLGQWPSYIVPSPWQTGLAIYHHAALLIQQTWITLIETVFGFCLGSLLGISFALNLMAFPFLKRWVMPLLIASQTIPFIVLAPILVLWLGYGLGAKITLIALLVFFPVTRTFLNGMQGTDIAWLELARSLNAKAWCLLLKVRVPAALPSLKTGLQMAAVYAPMGAVISEWVGAEGGLGHYLMQANANLQTDLMFACLIIIVLMTFSLSKLVEFVFIKIL